MVYLATASRLGVAGSNSSASVYVGTAAGSDMAVVISQEFSGSYNGRFVLGDAP